MRRGEVSPAAGLGTLMDTRTARSHEIICSNGLDRPCMSSSFDVTSKDVTSQS